MPAFSSEERQLLHDSIDEYFSDRYGAGHAVTLARGDGPDGFGREEWADYARLGWLGLMLPEAAGGSAGGLTEAGILFAAAGRHLAQEPLLPTLVLGAGAVERMGTPEQQELLSEIAQGRRLVAFLQAEPESGFARDHVAAVARREGEGYVLSGAKAFALGAHAADTLVVSARIGDGQGPVGLFLVPGNAPGLELNPAPALDGRRGAAARLDEVRLEAGALLGATQEDRLAEIDRLLDRAALAVCAEAAGAMAAAAALTTDYIKGRQQFGRSLSDFQVLQHRVVDMHLACEETRVAVHAALRAVDEDAPDAARAVWRAKAQTAQAARFVGGQGIQLHGGMGMTDEMPIGHYYKRLAMCEAMFGDAEWHLARLAEPAEG
ncbi:MAG: acyl-CoA dehydrogenase family protein [Pseudomonadota bacterium]